MKYSHANLLTWAAGQVEKEPEVNTQTFTDVTKVPNSVQLVLQNLVHSHFIGTVQHYTAQELLEYVCDLARDGMKGSSEMSINECLKKIDDIIEEYGYGGTLEEILVGLNSLSNPSED